MEEEEQTQKKTRINQHQQEEGDRISQLPDDILETILSLLTLKESCITSSLSKRWRNLFPSLPRLDFNRFLGSSSVRSHAPSDHDVNIDYWLESVRNILESRRTPVRICTICSYYFDRYREDFSNIIRLLCDNSIQDLTIDNTVPLFKEYYCHFTVPSCLYSCQTLTRIELYKCVLMVPSKFSGLRCLKTLKIKECILEDGDLQRMILGCRALERLTLDHCHGIRNLAVDADKLAMLDVSTHMPLAVSIVNAPQLEAITLRFSYEEDEFHQNDSEDSSNIDGGIVADDEGNDAGESEVSRLVRLLESLGNIQNLSLEFQSGYMEILRMERVALPVTLRSLLPKMKKLTLKMQLVHSYMVSLVSCLLNSCPNLEDIVIGDTNGYECDLDEYLFTEASVLGYWDRQISSYCMRNTLRAVTLYLEDYHHLKFWLKFVKYLLNHADVLKNLVIDCRYVVKELSKPENFLKDFQIDFQIFQTEVLQLRPASPDAVVELKTARRREFHLV